MINIKDDEEINIMKENINNDVEWVVYEKPDNVLKVQVSDNYCVFNNKKYKELGEECRNLLDIFRGLLEIEIEKITIWINVKNIQVSNVSNVSKVSKESEIPGASKEPEKEITATSNEEEKEEKQEKEENKTFFYVYDVICDNSYTSYIPLDIVNTACQMIFNEEKHNLIYVPIFYKGFLTETMEYIKPKKNLVMSPIIPQFYQDNKRAIISSLS